MPSFISDKGIWKPARERAIVVNQQSGEMEIYDGPDRQAEMMMKAKGGTMGRDARKDPDNIKRARELGMDVETYLEWNQEPTPEAQKAAEVVKTKVITHAPPVRKPGVQPQGGVAPGRPDSELGGFGDVPK